MSFVKDGKVRTFSCCQCSATIEATILDACESNWMITQYPDQSFHCFCPNHGKEQRRDFQEAVIEARNKVN